METSRGALREGDALVMPQRCDEVGDSIEPDVATDRVFGAHETIDESDERRAGVGAAGSGDGVAFEDERREETIAVESRSRIIASLMGSAWWR